MGAARSVGLRVRPIVSVDLSFPVDGVISKQSATLLGSRVGGTDVTVLYAMLGQTTGDLSRLVWDSAQIFDYLFNVPTEPSLGSGGTIVSQLRNSTEAAANLDRALMMRQNSYLTTYSPEILAEVRRVYHDDPVEPATVRHRLLGSVEDDIDRLHQGLTSAYQRRGWWGKVIEYAKSTSDNNATQYSGAGHIQFEGFTDTDTWGYEFRFPSAENDLRYHQSKAAVRQEQLNAWRMSEMCRTGDITFANELASIDHGIRALQAAYIDTLLFPSADGVVTSVFHTQGEFVHAGEPVMRVENDAFIYLVGTIKYRGMVRLGSTVTVSTVLFEEVGGASVTVSGEVVAVRGHDAVSEQWDLLVLCPNFANDTDVHMLLPLNYNFDFESTLVDVVTP